MPFNPDQTKQSQDVIFSGARNIVPYPTLFPNGSEVRLSLSQKHLGNK